MTQELGAKTIRGAAASGVSVAIARLASFATQVVLGAVLTNGDWGVYAGAISLATVTVALRDGAIADFISERGSIVLATSRRRLLEIAFCLNAFLALVLGILAFGIRARLGTEAVWILVLSAAALLIGTPSAMYRGQLRTELRFGALSAVSSAMAIGRAISAILAALLGFGAVSFVVGLPVLAVAEVITFRRITGATAFARGEGVDHVDGMARDLLWLLVAAAGAAFMVNGDFVALTFSTDIATVGLYFFAFRLVSQAASLVTAALTPVLIPSLSRLRRQPDVLRTRVGEILVLLAAVITPLSLSLALSFEAIDRQVWDGEWNAAAPAVAWLSLAFPIRATFSVARATLLAQGRYRDMALLTVGLGAGLVGVAAAVAASSTDLTTIAAAVAMYLIISTAGAHLFALRRLPGSATAALVRMAGCIALGAVLATGCWFARDALFDDALGVVAVVISLAVFLAMYASLLRVVFPDVVALSRSVAARLRIPRTRA